MTLDFFRRQGVMCPELCFLLSSAVGFPVSIYWMGTGGPGKKGTQYQAMPWDESPGPAQEFWIWYLCNRRQFYPKPVLAAAAFLKAWQSWTKRVGGEGTKQKPHLPCCGRVS